MTNHHKRQVDDGVVRSLDLAGIRPRYHHQSLANIDRTEARDLLEWVNTGSRQEPANGYNFIGGNVMEDLAILTARGLHVTGRSVAVMPLMRFQASLQGEDRDYLEERLTKAQTLLLTQSGPLAAKEEVFTARERRLIEMRLNDWLADGSRLLLHASLPLNQGWFSSQFLQRVAPLNQTIGEWK